MWYAIVVTTPPRHHNRNMVFRRCCRLCVWYVCVYMRVYVCARWESHHVSQSQAANFMRVRAANVREFMCVCGIVCGDQLMAIMRPKWLKARVAMTIARALCTQRECANIEHSLIGFSCSVHMMRSQCDWYAYWELVFNKNKIIHIHWRCQCARDEYPLLYISHLCIC